MRSASMLIDVSQPAGARIKSTARGLGHQSTPNRAPTTGWRSVRRHEQLIACPPRPRPTRAVLPNPRSGLSVSHASQDVAPSYLDHEEVDDQQQRQVQGHNARMGHVQAYQQSTAGREAVEKEAANGAGEVRFLDHLPAACGRRLLGETGTETARSASCRCNGGPGVPWLDALQVAHRASARVRAGGPSVARSRGRAARSQPFKITRPGWLPARAGPEARYAVYFAGFRSNAALQPGEQK